MRLNFRLVPLRAWCVCGSRLALQLRLKTMQRALGDTSPMYGQALARALRLLPPNCRQGILSLPQRQTFEGTPFEVECSKWEVRPGRMCWRAAWAAAASAKPVRIRAGRVIHIGSFSKTISPTLRLGFLVAPPSLAARFAEAAACLAPAPGPSVQLATAEFMREGHYMRHLRRMKRVYSRRRDALKSCLETRTHDALIAGLAVLLRLPDGVQDTAVAKDALAFGLAPAPLSPWYMSSRSSRPGLLLGVASVPDQRLKTSCDRLYGIIDRLDPKPRRRGQ
jgi:hypothetical protein